MQSESHIYRLTILEYRLDTFGHVNNAEYLRMFEEARWDLISARGFGLEQILSSGKGPVILEVNLKFKRELRLRDSITIETSCTGFQKKIGTLTQLIRNAEGELCCDAEFKFGLFDLRARKLLVPTPEFMGAVGLSKL